MIVKEYNSTREDGVRLFRTYSDKNVYIVQNETGAEYIEAIDIENAPYTYSETEKTIESDDSDFIENN